MSAVRTMENVTHLFEEGRVVSKDGIDLESAGGSNKLGLAECGDMDRQIAQVALINFGDVHSGLLDEIFQCMYFTELLGIRR